MALKLDECSDADFPRLADIMFDAFGSNEPYVDALFPGSFTPAGRAIAAKRLLQAKYGDPQSKWLKITDTSRGTIMGFAKYIIFITVPPRNPELDGDYWDNDEAKEYARHLFSEFISCRYEVVRASKETVIELDTLAVDPLHQYKGAGSMLVKWGIDLADEMGVEVTIIIVYDNHPVRADIGSRLL